MSALRLPGTSPPGIFSKVTSAIIEPYSGWRQVRREPASPATILAPKHNLRFSQAYYAESFADPRGKRRSVMLPSCEDGTPGCSRW